MSPAGPLGRESARTVLALLVVVGLVLVAVVLPAIGHEAPGRSLVPGQSDAATRDAVQRALQGQSRSSATRGGDSLLGGAMGNLQQQATDSLGNSRGGAGGSGSGSRFGALNPGERTGVGASESLVSESLRSRSSRTHFVVESPRATYWRTGAYETYTGDGWENERTGRRNLPLVDTAGGERDRLDQTITLKQPASALPSAWQPVTVRGVPGVRATPRKALRADEPLPVNTSYRVTSSVPIQDPETLRDAGRDYPAAIERRYTQLPADTPDRLRRFTDELTADADSPYEQAVAIERWLESDKTYSLSASHEGGTVADQFVFEMEQGYCEYFATSMVAMLRTQDIPARYVVGYSAGQPRGDDEYVVRAMNAHAWVEVYVPERGWVRFDPTPARSRLSSEARAARSATSGDGSADEAAATFLDQARDPSGSRSGVPELPDEGGSRSGSGDLNGSDLAENESRSGNTTGAPNGSLDPTTNASTDGVRAPDRPAIEITLLTDPVPGQQVTVEATRGSDPVVDAPVTFNGRRVGRTNASGMVTAPVPFARELVVGVADNATVRRAGSAATGLGAGIALPVSDTAPATGGRAMIQDGNATGNETTERFDVPTDLSLAVSGDVEPGATVTVRTTLANRTVSEANVTVDGERVGRTGPDGTLAVSLPAAESTTLAATRGVASGNRTLTLANVSVATSGFALPGLSVTVSVTDGGDPVAGAEVAVGGTTATTGSDGTAKVALPVATGATVAVTTPAGITKTAAVPYQFLTLGLLLALALGLVAAAWYLHRRASAAGNSLTEHISTLAAWLPGAFVSLLVALAVRGEALLDRIPALLAAVGRELRAVLRAAVAAVRAQDLSALVAAIPHPRTLLAMLAVWVRGLLAGARAAVPVEGSDDPVADHPTDDAAPEPVQSGPTARERIEEAWADFRERVPATDHDAMTPGELAREAVDAGFPDAPVRTLTDAFRRIEYGRRDPHGHVEAAERARDEIVADGEAGANAATAGDDGAATDGGTDVSADVTAPGDSPPTAGDDSDTGGGGRDD